MNHKKKTKASGVITFHSPLPASLLKSETNMTKSTARKEAAIFVLTWVADLKDATESRKSPSQPRTGTTSVYSAGARSRDEASPSEPQPGAKQDWISHASLRRLQAKMEAENQQVKEMLQPLLDAENGFVKELERFLSQRDVAELRRRELLHKRWTERVWFPLQSRVEEQASSCSRAEAKRRQSLYSHYLHHCNTKGFAFLETYDLKEYNPFLLSIKQPHHFKLSAAHFKDPLCLQLHDRLKGKRTARSCEAGCKYNLPQRDRPLGDPVTSQAAVEDDTTGRKSSRLDTIPYHISATAAPDGRCHQTSCWFSRCQQQQASLHQSLPASK